MFRNISFFLDSPRTIIPENLNSKIKIIKRRLKNSKVFEKFLFFDRYFVNSVPIFDFLALIDRENPKKKKHY